MTTSEAHISQIAGCSHSGQSPIDITHGLPSGASPLLPQYRVGRVTIANDGEFIRVSFQSGGHMRLTAAGEQYEVAEVHWHHPSEHTIRGERYPLEAHLVHRNRSGDIAVYGALYRLSETANAALEWVIVNAPQASQASEQDLSLDPFALLPRDRAHYSYNGSLTTPPYTEGVEWRVFRSALTSTASQIERLAALTGGENSRETQPLCGRLTRAYL